MKSLVSNSVLYEIEPIEKYTDEDLNWMNQNSRSSVEMKDKTSRPEIKDIISSINEYDNIYIGFPVWWYTCPHIVNTFLESFDFNGKNVRLFCTSGSSKADVVYNSLKDKYPFIKDCTRFTSSTSESELEEWVNNGN